MNILITGASRGIGAAAYALLKKTGHKVVGQSTMGTDQLIAGDLTDAAAPRDIWDTALDELGGTIDVLVNNAGIYEGVPDNASDEEWHAAWHRTLTINVQAAADLSRLAVSHLLGRGGARVGISGRIVNIASRAAVRGDAPADRHPARPAAGQRAAARADRDLRPAVRVGVQGLGRLRQAGAAGRH